MAITADMTHATLADLQRAAQRVLARRVEAPPLRYFLYQKALAWIRVAPRTSPQIAALLGISPNRAAVLCWQMRQRGLIEAAGIAHAIGRPALRYRAVTQ